uniref:Uncharacterized protein n=1 Tax=Nicotiana tabacum TaxID=4097 RepID=A0A1S4BYG6_TOBAC|nr:PREDICTED: uncharacterized protein LOC107813129 [Nicotiana tabacum]
MVGVETTEFGILGGKNKQKKEKESEGSQGDVRGMEKGVTESTPTHVGLNEETRAMVVWSEESAGEEEKTSPTRGRATRIRKKQSEAELEKALEESKRKVTAKGKKKVVEQVKAVEIKEMDLVLRNEDKAEEEEAATPKTKKRKNFKKKSPSKTKPAEPSTLAKRTRSAIKSRKVKVVE